MDLNYDYGDVVHTHGHVHTKPDSHKQVVDHALKEWCHSLFGEDAEEKCEELNEIEFHDIDDGSRNEIKISDFFKAVNNLKRLSGHYVDLEGQIYRIIFKGTEIIFSELNEEKQIKPDTTKEREIQIIKDDEGFRLKTDSIEITETNLKFLAPDQEDKLLHKFILNTDFKGEFFELEYDGKSVVEMKQTLRNLNMNKLKERIELLDEDLEAKQKEINRQKDLKVDEVSAHRKLSNMEQLEKDKIREIVFLVIFLILGICFGIFCVYTGFILELD